MEERFEGVRSTSWMCPGDRPGKASSARLGEEDNAQRPILALFAE